jgi:hypothetical protein
MPTAIRISDNLLEMARLISKIENRSITGQIEHWAQIGKIAEENPDLPYALIRDILLGLKEIESGEFSEYQFNEP